MRYISFTNDDRQSWGWLNHDGVMDLGARGIAPSLLEFMRAGSPSFEMAFSEDLKAADVTLTVPISGSRIFCIGLNYLEHQIEGGQEPPEQPRIFTRTWESVVASGSPIRRPQASQNLDFEGELALVIGTGGRHIAPDDAVAHVFGYSIFNDGSLRDFQSGSVTAGKNFDGSGSFGPCIVEKSSCAPWDQMQLETRLNGQAMQSVTTGEMVFGVPSLIAFLSELTTLLPGDVVATGTPSGVGWHREPPLWLKPGDVLEVEIDAIGILSNNVLDEFG